MHNLELLAEHLCRARIAKGVTPEQAAEQSGVYYYTLIALEAAKISAPTPSMLLRLAKYYDLDFSCLMQLAGHLRHGST